MVRRVCADRERQAVAIHNRHDFQALSALGRSDLRTSTLGHREGCIDEALFFIQRAALAKLVGNIHQSPAQNLVSAPALKAAMYGFVVRITLRQHVPLRARVEYPQHAFSSTILSNRSASSSFTAIAA